MADAIQTNSSGRNQVDRLHFTVGLLVLMAGVYFSVFALHLLMMR